MSYIGLQAYTDTNQARMNKIFNTDNIAMISETLSGNACIRLQDGSMWLTDTSFKILNNYMHPEWL